MTKQLLFCALAALLLSACSTDLTKEGSNVRLLNSAAEASKCQLIKTIFARATHGTANATKEALNEAAAAGANAFYVISATSEGANIHSDVVGNALICPKT